MDSELYCVASPFTETDSKTSVCFKILSEKVSFLLQPGDGADKSKSIEYSNPR